MKICVHLKFSTLVQQQRQRRCTNTRSNVKNACFLSQERNDMLKLGCTLPDLANICFHKTTSVKFYPFTETDKILMQKIREDMDGGPPIVFTRKTVVDETFIRNSGKICKSVLGIDASQLYPQSMCQPMPTGLYTRLEYDNETERFRPQQNKSKNFENMVMSYFQRQRPDILNVTSTYYQCSDLTAKNTTSF